MFLGLFKRKVKKAARPKTKKAKLAKSKPGAKRAAPKKTKAMPQVIGKITHYFPHVKAGVIAITKGTIAIGDTLQIKGHTTDFKQKVISMQIDNAPIKEAKAGQEVGLLVKSRVRHNDIVYK